MTTGPAEEDNQSEASECGPGKGKRAEKWELRLRNSCSSPPQHLPWPRQKWGREQVRFLGRALLSWGRLGQRAGGATKGRKDSLV